MALSIITAVVGIVISLCACVAVKQKNQSMLTAAFVFAILLIIACCVGGILAAIAAVVANGMPTSTSCSCNPSISVDTCLKYTYNKCCTDAYADRCYCKKNDDDLGTYSKYTFNANSCEDVKTSGTMASASAIIEFIVALLLIVFTSWWCCCKTGLVIGWN